MNTLKGYKTYIVAVALVLYAIGGVITGHLTIDQAVQLFGIGGIGAFLRSAIANS